MLHDQTEWTKAPTGVTEDTIKFHVENILGKPGVNSRSKAVRTSPESGLLRPEDT